MDSINAVYGLLPASDEIAPVRQFFWASVALSWVLTFIPLPGGRCRNYSIVDRLWSLYPLIIVSQWVCHYGYAEMDNRALVAVALVSIWSLRLTYSSVRRGDYAMGAEDYRWAHVRKSFDRALGAAGVIRFVAWEVFNMLFIALFQLTLLYKLAQPVRQLIVKREEWSTAQVLLAPAMALFLLLEAIADKQQYELQRLKRPGALDAEPNAAYAASREKEVRAGFVYTGLWRFSRHPNVFCEQAFWALMAFFAGAWNVPSLFVEGALVLIVLMWASVGLTESITLAKYPLYRAYQIKTSRLIPCWPLANDKVIGRAHKY
ncbi:hypothetical protein IWW37_005678 [Coemansia sp. RSA 2050]|nr:hypothetical protein IWW37_005678 [Coemansia sp. RSA 2050]KAJ2729337.1 hypothetical protein IW152_005662 [Coemansia sp. BCRC 34962]